MQPRRFERIIERLGNKQALCVVLDSFCACAVLNDFCYTKKDEKSSKYENGLVENTRLPSVGFQQRGIHTENHLLDSSRVDLVAAEDTTIFLKKTMPTVAKQNLRGQYRWNRARSILFQ